MKILLTLLLAAALCLSPCALAEAPAAPAPNEAVPETSGSLTLALPEDAIVLDYDGDPDQSNIADGVVQASFFAFDERDTLYEVYLLFPEDVAAGDTVSTQTCLQSGDEDSGIALYISTYDSEVYAAASQYEGAAYPENSRYIFYFTEVTRTDSTVTFAGELEADLIPVDAQDVSTDAFAGLSGSFRFSMDLRSDEPSLPDDLPSETTSPETLPGGSLPALVTPPDAKKI